MGGVSLQTIRQTYGENSLEYQAATWVVASRPRPSNALVTLKEIQAYFKSDEKLGQMHLLTLGNIERMMSAFDKPELSSGGAAGVRLAAFAAPWMQKLAKAADDAAKGPLDKTGDGVLTKDELKHYLTSLGTGAYLPFTTTDTTVTVPSDGSVLVITDDRMSMLEQRFAALTGEKTLLSVNVRGTKRVLNDYEEIFHDSTYPTPRLVGYTITRANMTQRIDVDRNGVEFERAQQCKFYQEPGVGYTAADSDDYAMGNKVVRTLSGYVGTVTGDQGHQKAFDTRSDVLAARQSCSLGNNAYQFGETNRQSYRVWEDGQRVAVRQVGRATVFVGDLFLSKDGKKSIPLSQWKSWTLGKAGTYGVLTYQVQNADGTSESIVLQDPRTKKPILFDRVDVVTKPDGTQAYKIDKVKYAAWVVEMKAKYPELAAQIDLCKANITRSLPIPSHRFMTSYWEPDTPGKKPSMSAWIAPNSYSIPTKEYSFSALVQAPYVSGVPSDKNGWRTNVDQVEKLAGVDLYSVLPNATEARLEADFNGFPELDADKLDCNDENDANVCTIWPSDRAAKPRHYEAMQLDLTADRLEDEADVVKKAAEEAEALAVSLEAAAKALNDSITQTSTAAERQRALEAQAAAATARATATRTAAQLVERKAAAKAARKAATEAHDQ